LETVVFADTFPLEGPEENPFPNEDPKLALKFGNGTSFTGFARYRRNRYFLEEALFKSVLMLASKFNGKVTIKNPSL
jgi:hypothetical protein